MSLVTVDQKITPLEPGDVLSRDEFLRRWDNMPLLQRAELIRGVVYMPSPVGSEHAMRESDLSGWVALYRAATPGCAAAHNATWLMGDAAPQPDLSLHILAEWGGVVRVQGRYLVGAPEFVSEVCVTSAAYDLHQKLELYREAGVREYLAILLHESEVRWHRLVAGRFEVMPAPADGIYRSMVFPGLWLDAAALLKGDLARVLSVLQEGLKTPDHAAFVQELARRKGQ
jgi:hypothetical protein